jgi:hypothetical protein
MSEAYKTGALAVAAGGLKVGDLVTDDPAALDQADPREFRDSGRIEAWFRDGILEEPDAAPETPTARKKTDSKHGKGVKAEAFGLEPGDYAKVSRGEDLHPKTEEGE